MNQGEDARTSDVEAEDAADMGARQRISGFGGLKEWAEMERRDWTEFARLPIFCSKSDCQLPSAPTILPWTNEDESQLILIGSIAIAAIYLTTLSYGELSCDAPPCPGG